MGELFYGMGFLATPEIIECSAADLLGQYVGQTVPKTRKKLQEGIGRVLFIDEAYRLIYGQYAAEAVDELVRFLAQRENEGKMVVILAGYPADIKHLMSIRPNIASHFPGEVIFNNIPPEDCAALLAKEFKLNKFTSEAGFLTNPNSPYYVKIKRLFRVMQFLPCWSNACDVRNLSKRILGKFIESPTNQTRILSADHIISCMSEIITQQRDCCIAMGASDNVYMPQQQPIGADFSQGLSNPQLASPPPPSSTDICTPGAGNSCSTANHSASIDTHIQDQTHSSMSQTNAVYTQTNGPRIDRNIRENHTGGADIREEGVSEGTWQELLKAKRNGSVQRNQRKVEIEKLERDLQEAQNNASGGAGGTGGGSNDSDCDAIRNQLTAIRQRMQDEERVQQAIGQMNRCDNGFGWHQVAGGYRCDGGAHLVTDMEVQSRLV